jgi:hypothetical protein
MKKFAIVTAFVILTIINVGCANNPIRDMFCGAFCDRCNQQMPDTGCCNGSCGFDGGAGYHDGAMMGTPIETGIQGQWNNSQGFLPSGNPSPAISN